MDITNQIILFCGGLLLVSIVAGMLSSRIGAPLLLVFLGLGLLAGEDGPGGIDFDDVEAAYLIASLALAVILFDGGLRTPLASVRLAWQPALALATVGVLLTAAITGGVAALLLGLDPLLALLMGAIVASTDAAAVFLLLHQRGMELHQRVSSTLELESGANDPIAVLLTVTLAGLVAAGGEPSLEAGADLGVQLGLGLAAGLAGGFALGFVINRLELAAGLYPVFAVAAALVVFGGTQEIGGSGFLAVYVAGIVAGNRKLRANTLIRRFHDGIAWVAQITMFVMLGLLVTPHDLVDDLAVAAVVAVVLIFVARPLAVALCLWPFRFSRRERGFVAWVGLRGAVPIFLAMIPILMGVPEAERLFNIAFLVVIASLLLQGWTVPWVARALDIELPPQPEPAGRSDIDLPSRLDRDLIGYRVEAGSPAAGRSLDDLHLPRRARLLVTLRDQAVVPRSRLERLLPDDYVLAICPPEQVLALDRLFAARRGMAPERVQRHLGDFVLDASAPLSLVAGLYDLALDTDGESTLGEWVQARLGGRPAVGDAVAVGTAELVVREIQGGHVRQVGLRLEQTPPLVLPAPTVEGLVRRLKAALRRDKAP